MHPIGKLRCSNLAVLEVPNTSAISFSAPGYPYWKYRTPRPSHSVLQATRTGSTEHLGHLIQCSRLPVLEVPNTSAISFSAPGYPYWKYRTPRPSHSVLQATRTGSTEHLGRLTQCSRLPALEVPNTSAVSLSAPGYPYWKYRTPRSSHSVLQATRIGSTEHLGRLIQRGELFWGEYAFETFSYRTGLSCYISINVASLSLFMCLLSFLV